MTGPKEESIMHVMPKKTGSDLDFESVKHLRRKRQKQLGGEGRAEEGGGGAGERDLTLLVRMRMTERSRRV